MNRLRRAFEKPRNSPSAEKKKPAPPKDEKKTPEGQPREEDKFKRAMEEFWVRAALELRSTLASRESEEETWE